MIDSAKLIDCCNDQRYFLQCSRHASKGLVVCRISHVLITFVILLVKLRSSSSIIVSSDDYYNCLSWPSLAMRKLCYSGHLRCVPANLRGTNFLNKLRKGFELFLWHLTVDSTFHFLSFRVFSLSGMVSPDDLHNILNAMRDNKSRVSLRKKVEKIRTSMNPHPANQKTMNVPRENGEELPGMQHKYRETVLFFPAEGISLLSNINLVVIST